jgi:hypothetical protein
LHGDLLRLLGWLEDSALGVAIRGAGVWAYAWLNLAHILGVATMFGAILILDLRLLGAWRSVPLAAIARAAVPVAAMGFSLAAFAGLCMITTNARQYTGNAFLLVKFPAIALGLLNVLVLSRLPAWRERRQRDPQGRGRTQLAMAGALSLLCWLAAITAGRMIAYW